MAPGISTTVYKIILFTVLLAVLLLTASWVFYADDRLPSHSPRIGTLSVDLPEGSGSGTAFLIDECGILTNFHVVFGPWTVTALRPPSHDFAGTFTLTEVTLPDGSHPATRAIPVAWGDYLGPERQWRRPEEDWAYLTLERCLGAEYGWFDLREPATYEPAIDKGFSAIGYSAGRQMADPRCAARADPADGARGWLHDCAALSGDSGGPMFRNGSLNVIAMASAYRAEGAGRRCLSARPEAALDWLGPANGCANVAVPVTEAMREKIWDASIKVGLQDLLSHAGYDAGPLGHIDSPQLQAAIAQAGRELGWRLSDKPMRHRLSIQSPRRPAH
jgi:hypothetical protein